MDLRELYIGLVKPVVPKGIRDHPLIETLLYVVPFVVMGGCLFAGSKIDENAYQRGFRDGQISDTDVQYGQAVCGPNNDTFVELAGIKYFSRADAYEISDLCK